MKVSEARAAAVDWVERHAAGEVGFAGAYFSGSLVYLPGDAEVPVGSDVDVMVVHDRDEPSSRRKFVHRGALIEASRHPSSALGSIDTMPSAHSLRFDSVIADPAGRLAVARELVAREYEEPGRVRRRCRRLWEATGRALGSPDPSAPWPAQVMAWAFTTSWTALLVLEAAVRNPTVRLRFLAARDVLAEHGLGAVPPDLLAQLGCRDLPRARAARHLEEVAVTFDLAAGVARTKFPYSSDITPVARPVAIDGIREQIERGNHREVVFWLVATYARCHMILAADAPELERERAPAFAALLDDLGVRTPGDIAARARQTTAFLPRLWEAVETMMAW